jgi:hypothetical protein
MFKWEVVRQSDGWLLPEGGIFSTNVYAEHETPPIANVLLPAAILLSNEV